jgi:carbon storage regulator
MLVLSRQRDQEIVIGDDIVVTVIEVRGDKVRLGIKAPLHIPVHRNEVYELIQRKAVAANPENLTNPMPEASAEG